MKITKEGIAILENDTHISKWVEESGRLDHDQNALPLILKYINEGDTVVDCGAFIGDHTIAYLNKVGESGRVVAIEPDKDAFECLVYNTTEYNNCFCLDMGVTDDAGYYHIEKNDNAGASHLSHKGDIKVFPMDNFQISHYLKRCDFIKLDIEGFEFKALMGATDIIRKFHPKLLIEINKGALERQGNTPEEIFGFLLRYNYSFRNIYEEQLIEGEQYDIICY